MRFENLDFTPMTQEDIPLLAPIMKCAFDDDSRLFFGSPEGGPEGYDDGSFLKKWGFHPEASAYRISRDGIPIGGFILFINESQRFGHLGCIFIDSFSIGQGYGSTAWRFVEHTFPQIRTWTVDTPAVSYRNHCFYINKCGFHVTKVEGDRDRYEAQFRLEKHLD